MGLFDPDDKVDWWKDASRLHEVEALLWRARKVITDQPGWDDSEEGEDIVSKIDEAFNYRIPSQGRGAYDPEKRQLYGRDVF